MEWLKACQVNDIQLDEVKKITLKNRVIAIYNLEDGFYATDDVCTHAVASLSDGYVEDGFIECPLHAGKFCIRTGKAQGMPVTKDIQTFQLKIENEDVFVCFDEVSSV